LSHFIFTPEPAAAASFLRLAAADYCRFSMADYFAAVYAEPLLPDTSLSLRFTRHCRLFS
jgi:hypothetical protein